MNKKRKYNFKECEWRNSGKENTHYYISFFSQMAVVLLYRYRGSIMLDTVLLNAAARALNPKVKLVWKASPGFDHVAIEIAVPLQALDYKVLRARRPCPINVNALWHCSSDRDSR